MNTFLPTDNLPDSDGAMFLPDFCRTGSVFLVVLTAELLALVMTLAASAQPSWHDLGLNSILIQWIALLSAGLICMLRPRMEGLSLAAIASIAYSLILLSTLVCSLLALWVMNYHADWRNFGRIEGTEWLILLRNMAEASIIGGILLRYFYLQQQYRVRVARESAARIDALQARIHPHFLFNTLNTISALITISPQQAEQAVENLAELMRAALRDTSVLVPFPRELALCKRYAELEQWRLGERLKLNWDLDDAVGSAWLPSLILQPLLENAILHGVSTRTEGGEVRISAAMSRRGLSLVISNPAPQVQKSARRGNGIGLENVRQRLELIYAGRAQMDISDKNGQFIVHLLIPQDERAAGIAAQ